MWRHNGSKRTTSRSMVPYVSDAALFAESASPCSQSPLPSPTFVVCHAYNLVFTDSEKEKCAQEEKKIKKLASLPPFAPPPSYQLASLEDGDEVRGVLREEFHERQRLPPPRLVQREAHQRVERGGGVFARLEEQRPLGLALPGRFTGRLQGRDHPYWLSSTRLRPYALLGLGCSLHSWVSDRKHGPYWLSCHQWVVFRLRLQNKRSRVESADPAVGTSAMR
jgi:hypothetical protein